MKMTVFRIYNVFEKNIQNLKKCKKIFKKLYKILESGNNSNIRKL